MVTKVQKGDKEVTHSLDFLQALLRDYHPRNFTVRLWDGSEWAAETDTPRFTLVLKHPGVLRRMFHDTIVIQKKILHREAQTQRVSKTLWVLDPKSLSEKL